MKFESKFGLGEIVLTKIHYRDGRVFQDDLFRVYAVIFCVDGTSYACGHSDGRIAQFAECELIGDPEYDQASGRYENNEEVT